MGELEQGMPDRVLNRFGGIRRVSTGAVKQPRGIGPGKVLCCVVNPTGSRKRSTGFDRNRGLGCRLLCAEEFFVWTLLDLPALDESVSAGLFGSV